MNLEEGMIYEGEISLSGGQGPRRHWIVVSPFGRTHIHSIDDPLQLHCWPISSLSRGIEEGRIRLVDTDRNHPLIRLQREKEQRRIPDTHLGLSSDSLERMFELLENAISQGAPYSRYAAGEIIAFAARSPRSEAELKSIRERVEHLLQAGASPVHVAPGPSTDQPHRME